MITVILVLNFTWKHIGILFCLSRGSGQYIRNLSFTYKMFSVSKNILDAVVFDILNRCKARHNRIMHKIICLNGDKTQFPLISPLIQLNTVINVDKFGNPVKYVTLSSLNLRKSSSNLKCLSLVSRCWIVAWAFFKFSNKCSTSIFIPPVSVCVATEFRLIDDPDWIYTDWNCSGVSLVLAVASLFFLTLSFMVFWSAISWDDLSKALFFLLSLWLMLLLNSFSECPRFIEGNQSGSLVSNSFAG